MGSRGPRKTPLEVLKKRGATRAPSRERDFMQAPPEPEKLCLTAPIVPAPTPDDVLPILAGAVKGQGLGREEHNLMLWQLAKLVSDTEKARLRWMDFCARFEPGDLTPDAIRIERALQQNYLSLSAQMIHLGRDFGLTPSSYADIPARAAAKVITAEDQQQDAQSSLEARI